ncbi:hypothetical protein PENNAL_c0390G08903 [Penicillium nalgiovense]|uniref:Uncharacterized protein n=1 Tax=Penicillium nalgiovense TaxID=60175 RepID=A0A1V6W4B5_PENNA|nr:hypothetical protein PENNAL_c0390G08903 [Penicillium nalgiovense]
MLRRSPRERPGESSGTARSFAAAVRSSSKPVDTEPGRASRVF